MQLYPQRETESHVLSYGNQGNGLKVMQIGTRLMFIVKKRNLKRAAPESLSVDVLVPETWNAIALTYSYVEGMAKMYVNGNLTGELDIGRRLLGTQGGISLVGLLLYQSIIFSN